MYFLAPAAKALTVSTGTSAAVEPTCASTVELDSSTWESARAASATSCELLPFSAGSIVVITPRIAALLALFLTNFLFTKPGAPLKVSEAFLPNAAAIPKRVSNRPLTTKPSNIIARSLACSPSTPVKVFLTISSSKIRPWSPS